MRRIYSLELCCFILARAMMQVKSVEPALLASTILEPVVMSPRWGPAGCVRACAPVVGCTHARCLCMVLFSCLRASVSRSSTCMISLLVDSLREHEY